MSKNPKIGDFLWSVVRPCRIPPLFSAKFIIIHSVPLDLSYRSRALASSTLFLYNGVKAACDDTGYASVSNGGSNYCIAAIAGESTWMEK